MLLDRVASRGGGNRRLAAAGIHSLELQFGMGEGVGDFLQLTAIEQPIAGDQMHRGLRSPKAFASGEAMLELLPHFRPG